MMSIRLPRAGRAVSSALAIATIAAGTLAAPPAARAAAVTPPSADVGYFQSRNVRWASPPLGLKRPLKGEAMHFSPATHSADEPFMSLTYFPQQSLQINQITSLLFDMYVVAGSTCGAGSPRIGLVLEDADNASNPYNGSQVLVYPTDATLCQAGAWHTANAVFPGASTWSAGAVGGGSNLDRDGAHAAAKAALGDHYRVTRVRLYFDAGGPDLWFDHFKINSMALDERAEDTTPQAQQPTVNPVTLVPKSTANQVTGYFMSRNARWGQPPMMLKRTMQGEALHFSSATRTENADFMATSFFPQMSLQLGDLNILHVDTYLASGECTTGTVRMAFIAADGAGATREVDADWTGGCPVGQWTTLNFLDANATRWSAPSLGLSAGTRDDAIAALKNWAPGYTLQVVRFNLVGGSLDAWVDNQWVGQARLVERGQDWSPGSQVANPGKQGDGFVANVVFPAQQAALTEDGVVVLTPDSAGRIKLRVRPYLDGHADPATGAWVDQDGVYEPGYEYDRAAGGYADILNVAFYNGGGAGTGDTLRVGLHSVGNAWFEGTLTLPAGFGGGVYTVVVNDNYPKTIPGSGPGSSADNRGSYFFLAKELLLRGGDAATAPYADLVDTPSAFTGPLGDYGRGYEGPRSLVIIAPPN